MTHTNYISAQNRIKSLIFSVKGQSAKLVHNVLFLLIMLLMTNGLSAQSSNYTVKGSVQDENAKALSFANVLVLTAADSTLVGGSATDDAGSFEVTNVPAGEYLVSVRMVGYPKYYQGPFELMGDLEIETIQMMPAGEELAELKVTGQKQLITREANKTILNVAEAEVYMGEDALEVLKKAPGVIVDQNNNISLKGKSDVMILVDGKETFMSREDVAKMLQGMPSSDIEKIEIIDNPSAKYEAEGRGGVIDIRLAKGTKKGWNGTANASTAKGIHWRNKAGLSLNARQEKLYVYANYNYNQTTSQDIVLITRMFPSEEETSVFAQDWLEVAEYDIHNLRTGLDYDITDQLNAGVNFRYTDGVLFDKGSSMTTLTNAPLYPYDEISLNTGENNLWTNKGVGFFVTKEFGEEGGELELNLDRSSYYDGYDTRFENEYFMNNALAEGPDDLLTNDYFTDIQVTSVKADYEVALMDSLQLSAGLKWSDVSTVNDFNFYTNEIVEGVEIPTLDETRTNAFDYNEKLSAAYVELNYTLPKWSVQAGLRMEHTDWEGFSGTLNQESGDNYTELFPTLTIGRTFSEKIGASVSYGRRIGRPDYEQLNPFVFYIDQYTTQSGNPFLQPEFTHAFGLTFLYEQQPLLQIGYDRTSSAIADLITQDDENNLTNLRNENYDRSETFYLGTGAPLNFGKWAEGMLQVFAFYNHFQTELPGEDLDKAQLSTYCGLNQTFNLPMDFKLGLDAFYQTPVVFGVFEVKSNYGIDLALSKKFLDDQLQVTVGASDIFHTNRSDVIIRQGTIDSYAEQEWDTQRLKLSLRYNFGNNNKISGKQKDRGPEELNRINGKG